MKKIIKFLSIFILLLAFPFTCLSKNIRIFINEKEIDFNTAPIVINDRTMVPMREIFEELGYILDWDEKNQKVMAQNGNSVIEMTINDKTAYVNYTSSVLDSPPIIKNNRTFVPLRFISESTGFDVYWNEKEKIIDITPPILDITKSNVNDSIVAITTNNMQGSGVIISDTGLIVTNYHVMEDAKYVTILLNDGRIYSEDIKIVGYNKAQDLVILKVDIKNLVPAVIGDSEKLSVHSGVFSVTSPPEKFNMTSTGKVLYSSEHLICTTTHIEHGSSGGGLFNSNGELVGIATAYDEANNYFFTPVNYVKDIKLDKNLSLKEFAALKIPLEPPTVFDIKNEENAFYLLWNNVNDAEYFYIYRSMEKDGEYKRVKNPLTDNYEWQWGYPQGFGINLTSYKKYYIKISSVNGKEESELSEPIEVIINNNQEDSKDEFKKD